MLRLIKRAGGMAIYNFEEHNPKKKNIDYQKISGIICVSVSVLALFCLITHFIPFMKSFLLGAFGLFCYPFFITALAVGFALIGHKKYVMPKKYGIFISLSIISILCILQLILVPNAGLNFWQYLARCYSQKTTAGGFVLGILTGSILYILNRLGAYIIFSALSVIFIALTIDYIHYLNKNENIKKVVKVIEQKDIEASKNITVRELEGNLKKALKVEEPRGKEKEKVNLTLNAKNKEESAEEIAKRKLGLLASSRQDEEDNSRYFSTSIQTNDVLGNEKLNATNDKTINAENNSLSQIQENLLELKQRNSYSSYPISNRTQSTQTTSFDTFKKSQTSAPNVVVHDSSVMFSPQKTNIQNTSSMLSSNEDTQQIDVAESIEVTEEQKPMQESLPKMELYEENDNVAGNPFEPLVTITNDVENDEQTREEVAEEMPEQNNNSKTNINSLDVENFSNSILASLKNENLVQTEKHESPQKMFHEEIKQEIKPIVPKTPNVYIKPPIELLTTESMDLSLVSQDVVMKREELEMALDTFGIPAKVIGVVIGPAVTRYELEMPAGVSIRKLIALQEDIAYNLSSNGDIRIEAPIPGRRAVGIEVPNDKIATVSLKDIIMSKEFMDSKSSLAIALGKDISGMVKTFSLVKIPHLLIAGTTGSGKSVCINSIILSLIYKYSPDEVKLILVDPKRVEFSMYNHLPHLLMPNVITDSEKALNALSWCVDEMERRFIVFANARCKNLEEYNESQEVLEGSAEKMPYIIFIIDELADLLMTAKKDAEDYICRILQKARAAGIHMILATQRPSVDVVTGKIKANLNARICFALMTFADSKTVLDQGGADKLLGKGDMLFMSSDTGVPKRIQGCFVTTKEIDDVVTFVKENNGDFEFDTKTEQAIINPPKNDVVTQIDGDRASSDGFDALMPQVLKSVIENGHASISMIQRKFLVGFPRAARIIDQMEEAGFISPSDGSKSRSVYITMEEYDALYGE